MKFNEVRCRAVVQRAAERARPQIDLAKVVEVSFVPFDSLIQSLGSYQIARVEFVLSNGSRQTIDVRCGLPSPTDRACSSDPHLVIGIGVDHDVPCTAEAPVGCATEPPPPREASVTASRALRVPSLDIPIDHLGPYEILVGVASLPDGALSERFATLVDDRPTTFWIDDAIRLEVRSGVDGRPPIGSIYRDPFDGPEPVHVFLVFNVTELTAPSMLRLANVVVR